MNITYHPVSTLLADNNKALRDGVIGVGCIAEGTVEETIGLLNEDQITAMARVDNTLMKLVGARISSLEVYANGAINVFIRKGPALAMYAIIRPEVHDDSQP